MSALRIAHVQPMTLDLYGHDDRDYGTVVRYSVSNLAAAQAAQGDRPEVHLLASQRPLELEVEGVKACFHRAIEPPKRAGVNRRFARQFSVSMLRALRRGRYDVVHFHGTRQLHAMFAAVAWRCERQGLPMVAQDRGNRDVGRVETALQGFGLRRSRALMGASQDTIERFAALGFPRSMLHLVPNAIDPSIFHPGPPRDRDNGSSGKLRLLYVSRLHDDKDPLTMADAVARIAATGRPVEVTVCGAGPLRGPVAERLAGTGAGVTFHDHLPHVELVDLYRSSDALVLTSLREGFNQSILEAMACGLPPVLTDIPGPRDSAGEAGTLVPVRDPEALAAAIVGLVDDPREYARRRELALARAPQFTWDAVARQVRAIYEEALS